MDRIVSISDRGNAAIHALALAAAGGGRMTAAASARALGVSPSYFAKVLQSLVHAGLLASSRGAAGGFELARSAGEISCLEVVEAVDGALPRRECLFPRPVCGKGGCPMKSACAKVEKTLRAALESTTIAAMAAGFK